MEVIIKNVKNIHSGKELFRTLFYRDAHNEKRWVWMDKLSYKPMIMMIEEEATIKQILEENKFVREMIGSAIVNITDDNFEYILKVRGQDAPEPPRKSGYYWALFDDRSFFKQFILNEYEPARYDAVANEWIRIGMSGPSVCNVKDWKEMYPKPQAEYQTRGIDEYIGKK